MPTHKMSARGGGERDTWEHHSSSHAWQVLFSPRSNLLRKEMNAEGNSRQKKFRGSRGRSGHCLGLAHTTYWFFQTAGQVHNRDIGGWHTESHSSEFPVRDRSQQGTAPGTPLPALHSAKDRSEPARHQLPPPDTQGGTALTH